ncbi:MAG: zf-HC2 domain-containing protein [Pyrinomonadaceae bacterium]
MIQENAKNQASCPREEIAAYVDGEISPREELELEMHFADCKICAEELNSQKKLLCALDSFCLNEREIELPENFTKVIVATAESNVSGLRRPQERRKAMFICSALFLLVLLGLGLGSEPDAILGTFWKFAEQFLAVGSFIAHLVFDLTVGITIVLRFLGHHFVFSSAATFGLIAVLFVISLLTLSRLVLRYNRA